MKGGGNEKDEDEGEEKRSRKKFNRFLTRRTSLTKSTIFEIIFHLFKNEIFLLNENEKNGKIGFQCPTFYRGNRNGLDYSDVNFAPAKFRAAAKNEKLGNVRCENLVKKLGNFTKKTRNI